MVSGQILDPEKSPLPYPEKTRAMYSSEDFFEDVVTGGRKHLGHLRLSPA